MYYSVVESDKILLSVQPQPMIRFALIQKINTWRNVLKCFFRKREAIKTRTLQLQKFENLSISSNKTDKSDIEIAAQVSDKIESLKIALSQHLIDGNGNAVGQIQRSSVGNHRYTYRMVVIGCNKLLG